MLEGKIFITGGAGFLGRGIMRRALLETWPCSFTIYSRDEYKQDLCRRKFSNARYILGDIRDRDNLSTAILGHDIVIHAAAFKYIPEAEVNVVESIGSNILGSMSLIQAARDARVSRVIGISTDKAVLPINVYGMTKALMERMFTEIAHRVGTRFTTCRYGNVVGSTGSVVPLFQYHLAKYGQLQVTNPEMTRFWISVNDAIDLILFALHDDRETGSISIPRPKAMTMLDVAKAIAGEAPIRVIGPRPGEKVHEYLMAKHESLRAVEDGSYYEVGYKTVRNDPFEIVSSNPESWMGIDEMRALIDDAALV